MDGLETIVVDLLQSRLKAGDAIIVEDAANGRCLVSKVEVGRFAMPAGRRRMVKGSMVPVHAVKISFYVPGGSRFYVVPMLWVESDIDLVQTGRHAFDIILSNRARKSRGR